MNCTMVLGIGGARRAAACLGLALAVWLTGASSSAAADGLYADLLRPFEIEVGSGHAAHAHDSAYAATTHSLQFTHPMVTESPSPDTKLRLDYLFTHVDDLGAEADAHGFRAEIEYAFNPFISVAVTLPYLAVEPKGGGKQAGWDNIHVGLKLANYAWADHGILASYGIEISLPSGDDAKGIGSDHIVTYEPFFLVGFRQEAFQVVAGAAFGLPTHQRTGEEVENEFEGNLAVTYAVTGYLNLLGELTSEIPLTGAETGHCVVNLAPGVQLSPLADQPLVLGLAGSFPVSEEKEYEYQVIASVFYHL